ncbi:hypothetical protein [Streptomyces sp. NPDC058861]|uniref:hypothetical protein n=1 Tax=Streptomyces sp. NPDC058861 TaxID=3346653 RepID=UPI003694F86A
MYVPGLDPGSGMSAGHVNLSCWERTGIPILLDRPQRLAHDGVRTERGGSGRTPGDPGEAGPVS